ncbi:MAG: NfeD family protein [Phycisphaerales bacterium]
MLTQLTSTPSLWFTIPALVGTIFFIVRLAMATMGIEFGDGADGDAGGLDLDFSGADAGDGAGPSTTDDAMDHAETSSVFKFISIQTVTAFAMGFGLGGLMALHTFGLTIVPALGVAIGVGAAFSWLIVWLFKLMYSMESSGNISIKEAWDAEGIAAAGIPPTDSGTGRVRVVIGDRQRTYAARTDESDAISMGDRVRVVRINRDNTVTVVRA